MRCLAAPRAASAAAGTLSASRRRLRSAPRPHAPARRRCAAADGEPGSTDTPRSRAEWLDWGDGARGAPSERARSDDADAEDGEDFAGWSQGEQRRRAQGDGAPGQRNERGAPPFRDSRSAQRSREPASARTAGGDTLADVTPLSREEQQALLPVSATGAQYAYYWGAFDTALQRFFVSLFGGLVTSSAPLIAVPAGLYFLWAPVALAARRNLPLRKYPYAGLWHARVLQAGSHASRSPGGITFDAMGDAFLPKRRTSTVRPQPCVPITACGLMRVHAMQVTRVLIGDESGARLQMEVPFEKEHSNIRARALRA